MFVSLVRLVVLWMFSLPPTAQDLLLSASRRLLDESRKQYSAPRGAKLYLVCFHMPVTIAKVGQGHVLFQPYVLSQTTVYLAVWQ